MTGRLRDKVAIVTGSSRGLGLASAIGMAEHGARVVISGRKADACDAAAARIQAACDDSAGSLPAAQPVFPRLR